MHRVSGKKRTAAATPTATGESGVICHRCGIPGHKATTCKFRERICHKCKKRGPSVTSMSKCKVIAATEKERQSVRFATGSTGR